MISKTEGNFINSLGKDADMKEQYAGKVLIAIVAIVITCVSYTAQAQSACVRAVSRSTAAQSVAEQVRRDSNSINCHALGHLETRYGVNWPQSNRYQTVCYHGRPSKGRATRY